MIAVEKPNQVTIERWSPFRREFDPVESEGPARGFVLSGSDEEPMTDRPEFTGEREPKGRKRKDEPGDDDQ